jgi:hypothetical protein
LRLHSHKKLPDRFLHPRQIWAYYLFILAPPVLRLARLNLRVGTFEFANSIRLLRAEVLAAGGEGFVAWDEGRRTAVRYDPAWPGDIDNSTARDAPTIQFGQLAGLASLPGS